MKKHKSATKKHAGKAVKRHIEDVPFYKFRYGIDDLPLDPAKPFILEQIARVKLIRPSEDNVEFYFQDFPSVGDPDEGACGYDGDTDTEKHDIKDIRMPDNFQLVAEKPKYIYSFSKPEPYHYPWLDNLNLEKPSETSVHKVTTEILNIYRERRVNIFHEPTRTRSALYSNEHQKLYAGPSDTIGAFKSAKAAALRLPELRKRKKSPEFRAGNPWAVRTTEEIKAELARVSKVIDKLIEPDIKRGRLARSRSLEAETTKKTEKCDICKVKKYSEPKKPKIFDPQEYMERILRKEQEKFKYMEGLLPVDPEEQKDRMLQEYEYKMKKRSEKFTTTIERRTISLMKNISVLKLETYPSKLIKKLLPKIDTSIPYLREAYKFIQREEKLWPDIFPEVMLMDYLFNPENRIKEAEAILIISCLIDLQEDYRFHVKRDFLRYVLESRFERKRLQLEREPPDFPILSIKSPVPWKARVQIARNRLDQVFMITHPVLQALNTLWHQLYHDILIFDTRKLYSCDIPLNADEITELLNKSCLAVRDILLNDWLPRCADLLDAMRNTWKDLIPMNSSYGGRAAILFNCVHALMSYHLQGLIARSIKHFYKVLCVYRGGNLIDSYDPDNKKLLRRPLMTLVVSVVGKHFSKHDDPCEQRSSHIYRVDKSDPMLTSPGFHESEGIKNYFSTDFVIANTGKMFAYPYMNELPNLFVSYFINILKVGYDIPRLEYVMSQRLEEYGHLHYIDEYHVDMELLYDDVRQIVENNSTGPTTYLYPIYRYFCPLLNGQMKTITESIFTQITLPGLPLFEVLMAKLQTLLDDIYCLRNFVPLNLFMLDNRHANETLCMLVHEIIDFITNYFRILNVNENRRICDDLEEMSMKAGERPEETAEVVALQNYLNECKDERIMKIKDEIKEVLKRVIFLLYYATLDGDDIHLNTRTFLLPSELEQVLELSANRLSVVRENLEIALKERRTQFEGYINSEKRRMEAFRSRETHDIMSLDELKEKVDTIEELFGILEKCSREAKAINVDENLLQIDQSFFPVLTELVEKMEPIEKLWKTAYEFERSYEIWMFGPFTDLNADGVREEIDGMYKIVYRLIRQLTNNPSAKRVAEQTRQKIDKFRVYLPIMDSICREGLETRHWDQITVKLGKPCNPGLYPSLKNMIDIDIMSILPQLEEISNAAFKEFELNKQLIGMQTDWLGIEFEVLRYRDSDTFILAAIDDIQTILDDQVLKAQAMRRSPYIAALGTKADDWENKLIEMQDVLDQWIQVQSTWMYLEPIFSSEDIMRQMPVEGRNFKAVDKVFRKIMKYTNAHKSVIEATDYPDLLQIFRTFVNELEAVQKGLNTYLEQKRLFFARFFFLSNDELLEILSETKDPMRVQPHLKKCFEGIYFLNFNEEMEITAMVSAENEVVKLVRKVNPNAANGLVELWLKDVESAMLDSLHEEMRLATEDYAATEREIWVTAWPGQVVQGIACLMWTVECEEAIVEHQLDICLEKNNQQIRGLVHLVRTPLGKGTRITIEALIVLDVHARDIVLYLVDKNVQDTADFDWISQLRYYWRLEEKAPDWVAVSMVVTDVKYGMEYLGNISRLVVTPLTDRCFRTLMGALKLCMGGAPEGPAGTGKTESTKDLAKSVATKCVVFNCSDGLDYKALGKFFKGLAQSGAWACFDEFNRIELEVLSVVAQQILTIQRAIAKKVVKFFFEDTWLRLDPTCAVFITMNPGYAGRTELPDNLKVLFRTVAMMVPDYAMIGEITLYSNGFDEARPLAQKIVHTYKLCSEQLSSQSHYDYGMRAVKSVLLASSSLRQLHPNLPEAQVVLRAIIDVNLPKFLEQDVSLFIGIYNDLFPGIEVPQPARDDVLRWIYKVLADKNLQATAWYIEKILQVYEMLLVRHGLMIVGAPMGGKTTSYQTLAIALKGVSADKTAKAVEYPVSYRIINPKAISMGQLYGNFDPISHEWSDGVLAKTFRDMATVEEEERNWVLFDGPVDAVWIENLNTVLDDNKKLCLMSGEIIIMSKFMNMMFEPADLEQASPATVSRCGMIYMEPALLGWRCVHKSFFAELGTTGLNDIYMALYEQLVEWLVPAANWVLKSCTELLDVPPLYKYQMMSIFFKHYLSKQKQLTQIWFQQTFLFCFAWAFASTLTADGHRSFDGLMRKILYGGNEDFPKPKHFSLNRGQMFPEKLPLTDYRFDLAENWWPWLKTDEIVFEHGKQISELIVPTKETGLLTYWMEASMTIGRPFLVCGPTGTGKSATINNYILGLPKQSNLLNVINFSARTSAQQVQESVMMKLDRRRKGVFGPPVGKKCVVFCDNVAMPSRDTYGSQPPLELIRQWFDHGYWSDLKDTTKIELIDLLFLGAMGVPGGSNFIFPRFYRHCFTVVVDAFDDATIVRIFQTIGEWHFNKEFPEKVILLNRGLSEAMVNIYREAMAVFLPTPAKSHYTFSLRDVTRTFQGIVLVPAKRLTDPEKLARLWAHETYRVFYDRLIEQRDRDLLLDMTKRTCKACFRFTLEQAMGDRLESNVVTDSDMRSLFYGTYMEPDADPKIYDEVDNYEKLEKVMHYYLQDYNTFSKTPMDLVLFRYAIEHISRTARVLQMPSGNILMVGMGGSGRRSAAKLAASIAEAKLCTVTITKTYSMNDWREDIKKMLMGAGTSLKPTVFLFSDTQAVDEAFIEDINGILNTGDLPNLYTGEDKAAILEAVSRVAKELERKIDSSPIEMYAFYIERVRALLHVSLAFSPIGNKFKERLRIFPSLITGCTIDWFTSWPSDALIRVAETFIASMGLNREEEPEVDSLLMSDTEKKASEEFVHELTDLENSLVEMVIHFNQTVIDASERCFFELGRRNYVTPTAYLELLKTLKNFYSKKCNEISLLRDRYTIGLDKLGNAASQVGEMQENLYELQPQLKIIAEETDKIMVNIERETAEAEKKKEIVGADEAAANEAAAASQAIKDDCESDLAEAIPALQAALDALNTLKPADVTLVKSMKNPPAAVKLVLEAVCVLRGFKADRKPDPSGKVVDDYWGPSVKMLGDLKFLENLKNFDKDNIPPPIIKKIRDRYISDRDFDPDKIKNVSTACEGLCRWVRAMDVYDKVAKIVAPKQAALAEAENELSAQMEKLNAKRAELQEILDKLQKLNDFFAEKSRQKKGLEDDIDMCEKKLTRAEKLLGGLGGEKTRWSEAAETLGKSLNNIIGDVLLSAGFIAYLGFFTTEYRASIAEDWNDLCHQKEIPCSEKFSLAVTLGNPMQIRAWSLCGLPSDNFSVENGIIVSSANRFPLMIDPQGQANKWVKNMEKNNELKVIKQTDDNYMKILENSIIFGFPVLLENVGETIDSNLTPVLEKNIVKQKGQMVMKFGDVMIDYNANFRFYITTCLKNPIYSPETVVMVTLLNFMITEQGLREQLLATVVAYERPDLQEKKEQLIVESAKNRDMLYNIESKILEVLSSSEGNVLEDENAINILSSSKTLSEDIQAKQIVAVATEIEIDEARQRYVPVAKHSAILFFCITELSNIDPMYQYSLGWFINLFINTILKAPKSNVLSERLQNLNDYFTKSVYINVCRSLFEKHKLVISFVMCLGILVSREEIEKPHLIFFLTGGVGLENPHPNPSPKWLSDKAWSEIVRSSNLSGLENLYSKFAENVNKWQEFYELVSPDEEPFPSPFEHLDQVHRLIVLKCLRPDKVVPAVRTFITKNMDRSFVESPPFDLAASFAESAPTIPLVFLLSPGSDPMASVLAFAKTKGMSDKVKSISLGQGQGPRAEKMIYEAVRHGAWVILQNCHVAISWMNELERICSDDTIAETAHADYRLWCTSYPSPVFPVSVLQNSVKMTNEAPKGLKMNMLRSFGSDPLARDKFYSNAFIGKSAKYWLRGVFALVFFHAVINERKEFGPLGWNIPYEFGESDLKISLLQLKMFIAQNESIPFHGHVYLTGECNYGGRVTDDKDRRLLISLLTMVYNQNTIDIDNYPLSSSGDYRVPLIPNRINSQAYISTFPLSPKPEVFGLHENADINRNNKETSSLLAGVLLTQTDLLASTKKSSSAKADAADPAFFICKEILGRLPKKFDTEEVLKNYPIIYTNSMNTVLRQELIRFNRLLDFIRKSLVDIGKAVQGQIAMIPQLERVHKAMVIGKLPPDWVAKSYPSLKPLGSYINDFLARLEFFQTWIDRGEPSVYWLSGFYFTQSFLTGVLQNLSRKKRYQIDLVTIRFDLTAYETEVPETPEVGAYVRGLYLEAARWNREAFCLDESFPKVLFDLLPIIFAMPMLKTEIPDDPEHLYDAPAYKTSERRGTLSTTGHSTNFVMFMKIPTVKKPMHWINRGTAILCQLDD